MSSDLIPPDLIKVVPPELIPDEFVEAIKPGYKTEAEQFTEEGGWTQVSSSNVGRIMYDKKEATLYVYFHHGNDHKPDTYAYYSVPDYVARAFFNSKSKGRFEHKYLRSIYTYYKIA